MEVVATIKDRHDIDLVEKSRYLCSICKKVYRCNLAKPMSEQHRNMLFDKLNEIRNIDNDLKIMLDIPYPGKKVRIYCKTHSVRIKADSEYTIIAGKEAEQLQGDLYITDELYSFCISEGDCLIYDMGQGGFQVKEQVSNNIIIVRALNSFVLQSMKSLSLGVVKEKAYGDVIDKICMRIQPDYFAFSFVEQVTELTEAIVAQKKYGFKIVSKIETELGINNLNEIVNVSDAIMLARGDLGINTPLNSLYNFEQKISHICNRYKRKYLIASGFMNSCITDYLPSRSDMIDLAYALSLSPDGVVLNTDLVLTKRIESVLEYIARTTESLKNTEKENCDE